jgi:hypothetical protein
MMRVLLFFLVAAAIITSACASYASGYSSERRHFAAPAAAASNEETSPFDIKNQGGLDAPLVTLGTFSRDKGVPIQTLVTGKDKTDDANLSSANAGGIERKIIYSGEFIVGVYDIEKAQNDILERLKESGGYIERQTTNALVIRIPADKFSVFTGLIEKIGRVYSKNIQSQDVTEQYFDVELRLKTRREYLDSLKNLLDQAGKLEEKLAVQREIACVIQEIEQLEGRMRVLSSLIAFSTITIEFRLISENVSVKPLNLARQFDFLNRLGIEILLGR